MLLWSPHFAFHSSTQLAPSRASSLARQKLKTDLMPLSIRMIGAGADNEVQRTMLEIVNQLDGFDPRGNIKVLMATNRPDTLDPALLRPGRLDRKIEVGLPDLEGRSQVFKIHAMSKLFLILQTLSVDSFEPFKSSPLVLLKRDGVPTNDWIS